MSHTWLFIGIFSGFISIGVALYLFFWVKRQDPGSKRAQEVAGWISSGLLSQKLYTALTLVAVIIGFVIAIVFSFDLSKLAREQCRFNPANGIEMALASLLARFAPPCRLHGNERSCSCTKRHAAADSLNRAFRVAFYAGAAAGLAMVVLCCRDERHLSDHRKRGDRAGL